jgi:hypothetical protein
VRRDGAEREGAGAMAQTMYAQINKQQKKKTTSNLFHFLY